MKASELYFDLLTDWCDAMVSLQISDTKRKEVDGGIICPACKRIHGRSADAILPMLYMAKRTGEEKYLRCARRLFQWSDSMFREGGYYINDIDNDWPGITVFFSTQLGEALQWFSDLLTESEKQEWMERFFQTARYVRENIDKIGGTINYPAAGAYNMALAGKLSEGYEREKYFARAKKLAQLVCSYILADGLLCGEGHPCDVATAKKHRAIDIGYNMEESIPALLEYSHLVQDEETEEFAVKALKTHLKFYLPDGGLDNSFGSRAYKWSYWGSRTSDGIQAAAALMGEKCPEFQRIAYENALLLRRCTHEGLLSGGPMFQEAGEVPCVHHTFCHVKVLAKALMILESSDVSEEAPAVVESNTNTVEYFPAMGTYLVRAGKWRATLTDYDYEYCPASHATGGALTLLWHEKAGPVCVGTMNRYYVVEPNNMQILLPREDICLTPRIEYMEDGVPYRNIHDLTADFYRIENTMSFASCGKLVDERQKGSETYRMRYEITEAGIQMEMKCSKNAEFILPVVASKRDKILRISDNLLNVQKENISLTVQTNGTFLDQPTDIRIFNPVGGYTAYPARMSLVPGVNTRVSIMVDL